MPNYKTTVECAIHNAVGYTNIEDKYIVDGSSYNVYIGLHDANDELISINEYYSAQFRDLTPDTDYILHSYYDNGSDYILIPDTAVSFKTKATTFYTPSISIAANGDVSVAAMDDSYWDHMQAGYSGFGIGVVLRTPSGQVVQRQDTTPCTFTGLDGQYTIEAYSWSGHIGGTAFYTNLEGTKFAFGVGMLAIFAFPEINKAELHIRLQNFTNPSEIVVFKNDEKIFEKKGNVTNKVYVAKANDLDANTEYTVTAVVKEGGQTYSISETFTTKPLQVTPTSDSIKDDAFKDFYIAVGQPGAYNKNMDYEKPIIALKRDFNIRIKHAPYSVMPKIKNVVVQSWKDEDGDDVWLPRVSDTGGYKPAITHDAVEYTPTFVAYFKDNNGEALANQKIRELVKRIEGRWLKIWDEYTHIGYEGVYLLDVDDDPKFKRRNYDHVEFKLKFKVNGANIDEPFKEIGNTANS